MKLLHKYNKLETFCSSQLCCCCCYSNSHSVSKMPLHVETGHFFYSNRKHPWYLLFWYGNSSSICIWTDSAASLSSPEKYLSWWGDLTCLHSGLLPLLLLHIGLFCPYIFFPLNLLPASPFEFRSKIQAFLVLQGKISMLCHATAGGRVPFTSAAVPRILV